MILLVAKAGAVSDFEAVLGDRHTLSASVAEARNALATETPRLVVLDRASVGADADALLADVQAREDVVPAVVVAEDRVDLELRPFDELLVAPVDEATLADAVDRGVLVGEYRRAVRFLYDQCRTHADAGTDPLADETVRRARERADDLLRELFESEDAAVVSTVVDWADREE